MIYDSARVRHLARSVQNAVGNIRGLSGSELRVARASVAENLRGKTADALTNALEDLDGDVSGLVATLDGIASELFAYARRLDEADRQAEQLIGRQ